MIFLLSAAEAERYFPDNNSRIAKLNGKPMSWWVQSPGGFGDLVACVEYDGCLKRSSITTGSRLEGIDVTNRIGVRPAMWLNLE